VRDKLISFDEARWRYLLSHKEFRQWEQKVDGRHTLAVEPKQPPELRKNTVGASLEDA
jgi:hypothetical protein